MYVLVPVGSIIIGLGLFAVLGAAGVVYLLHQTWFIATVVAIALIIAFFLWREIMSMIAAANPGRPILEKTCPSCGHRQWHAHIVCETCGKSMLRK